MNSPTFEITVEDAHVDVPGGVVFVRKWLPLDSTPPLMLMHDSLGCVELWRDFPAALARSLRRTVVAYDRLGFGKSSVRIGLPSNDFVAEEARIYFPAILGALGIENFSVFGHSVGGAMAVTIAAAQGKRCNWIVTESAQAFIEQRTTDGIRSAMKQFEDPDQFKKLTKLHGEKAQWVLDAWTKVWLAPEFAGWSLDRFLRDVECPVLAIHGDRDEFGSTDFADRIVSGVKGRSRLAILNACGHVPHREQQDAVLDLVYDFDVSIGERSI